MDHDIEQHLTRMQESITELRKWAFGNGKQGVAEQVRDMKQHLDKLESTLGKLEIAERARADREIALKNQVKGATTMFSIAIGLLGAGGVAGWFSLAQWLHTVLDTVTASGGP